MALRDRTPSEIEDLPFVELLAELDQTSRPPGGRDAINGFVRSCFVRPDHHVLDVGCNTGYVSLELARIADCRVTGVDLSEPMIERARERAAEDPAGANVEFEVGDAESLPYDDGTFDRVVCGGSTAFVEDRLAALEEYRRVVDDWGFVGEANYFYSTDPPAELLDELHDVLGASIEPWDLDYWTDLYERAGFEIYEVETGELETATDGEIRRFAELVAADHPLDDRQRAALVDRLEDLYALFNRDHEYMDYAVFSLRKRAVEDPPASDGFLTDV